MALNGGREGGAPRRHSRNSPLEDFSEMTFIFARARARAPLPLVRKISLFGRFIFFFHSLVFFFTVDLLFCIFSSSLRECWTTPQIIFHHNSRILFIKISPPPPRPRLISSFSFCCWPSPRWMDLPRHSFSPKKKTKERRIFPRELSRRYCVTI